MERVGFIIGSQSYILAKGMHLVVNEVRNAYVMAMIQETEDLHQAIEEHNPSVVFVSSEMVHSMQENAFNELRNSFKEVKWLSIEMSAFPLAAPMVFDCVLPELANKMEITTCLNDVVTTLTSSSQEEDESVLSEREQTVLQQIALGLTNKEIAQKLFISQHTVITHRKKITQKLGIKTISGLTVYAIINDLISMEDIEQN